jgi:hypothetical protein
MQHNKPVTTFAINTSICVTKFSPQPSNRLLSQLGGDRQSHRQRTPHTIPLHCSPTVSEAIEDRASNPTNARPSHRLLDRHPGIGLHHCPYEQRR